MRPFLPFVLGLVPGLVMAFRRRYPALGFFSVAAEFVTSLGLLGIHPISLAASGAGLLILLVAGFLFFGVASGPSSGATRCRDGCGQHFVRIVRREKWK